MRPSRRPMRWAALAGLGAVCGFLAALVFLPMLDEGRAAPATSESPWPAEPEEPAAVTAARLTRPVTTTPDDAGGVLSLVDAAHTIVFAPDRRDEAARAGLVALSLHAPLVLVPVPEASGAVPSPGAAGAAVSEPAGDATEDADDPSPQPDAAAASESQTRTLIARAARRCGVVRAIVLDGGLIDVARDSGADEIIELSATAAVGATTRQVMGAAAAGRDAVPDDTPTRTATPAPASTAGASHPAGVAGFDVARYRLPPATATGAALLVRPRAHEAVAAVVTAHAAGHAVVTTRATDLRADPDAGARLAALADGDDPPPLVLAGDAFAEVDPDAVTAHAAVAMTGVELPGGDQLVIDPDDPTGRRYVGLYGVPQSPALGVLGEQPVPASVERAKGLAGTYRDVVDDEVDIIPCFEIIATVASASAGEDDNYSNEQPGTDLRVAVDAAGEAGLYVLLDLQPGRTDFLTQAKRYRKLLREPHVGLALDPEWRLRPDERHLEQIGSVGVDEVNEVTTWLADLVVSERLPQKMVLLHQFRTSMLRERQKLDTTRDELAFVIQMDGQGPQSTKLDTWAAIRADAPPRVHFGWKNFYDEDTPTRSPADTMALDPPPVFVSYQ